MNYFVKGLDEGTTQISNKSVQIGSKLVFNFPLEVTFRSTNPFGCLFSKILFIIFIKKYFRATNSCKWLWFRCFWK